MQLEKRFLDLGYGVIGIRNDKSRNDLISSSGNRTGSFTVNPKVAWFVAAGAKAILSNRLSLLVKAKYRIRYYDKKDGDPLINNIEHGTQNISPFIGLHYLL